MLTTSVTNPEILGSVIRDTRRALGLTQPDLALSVGVGVRFIVDIENGKPTAQIGKIIQVLIALGISLQLVSPDRPGTANGRS